MVAASVIVDIETMIRNVLPVFKIFGYQAMRLFSFSRPLDDGIG